MEKIKAVKKHAQYQEYCLTRFNQILFSSVFSTGAAVQTVKECFTINSVGQTTEDLHYIVYGEKKNVVNCKHSTVYNVECSVFSLQYTVYSVQSSVCRTQYTVYSVQCAVYTQYTVYSVQCVQSGIECVGRHAFPRLALCLQKISNQSGTAHCTLHTAHC